MTVRLKLALAYGLLILATGTALVAVSYSLVAHNVPKGSSVQASAKDVQLRAEKTLGDASTSQSDRRTLTKLLQQSPREQFNFLKKGQATGDYPLSPPVQTALEASLPVTIRAGVLHQLLVQSMIVLTVLTVLSLALGWLVAGRALRPLRRITATASELSASNLHRRIALRGPDDELSRLANTFDAMLDRLAAAFEGQRRFVANASHELRTPLTVMATEIDVTLMRPDASTEELRHMGVILRAAVDRSDRLVTSLLALARVEEGLEVVGETDLAAVATAALERRTAEIDAAHLRLNSSLGPAPVLGDAGLLDRLVENLVENAIVHNIDGGWVSLVTWTVEELSILEVGSSGVLVRTEDLPRLFTPFERLDVRSSSGRHMGLGLSIVRAVATSHGGQVSAEPLQEGGLRVTVRLPASAAGPA